LFCYMVHESGLPEADLTTERLTKEAQILLGAGSVSTARTLHFIIFYLLTNSLMRKQLEDELEGVISDWPKNPLSWAQLEKLPYLQAVIKEGLR
jgi:cytochrome P450